MAVIAMKVSTRLSCMSLYAMCSWRLCSKVRVGSRSCSVTRDAGRRHVGHDTCRTTLCSWCRWSVERQAEQNVCGQSAFGNGCGSTREPRQIAQHSCSTVDAVSLSRELIPLGRASFSESWMSTTCSLGAGAGGRVAAAVAPVDGLRMPSRGPGHLPRRRPPNTMARIPVRALSLQKVSYYTRLYSRFCSATRRRGESRCSRFVLKPARSVRRGVFTTVKPRASRQRTHTQGTHFPARAHIGDMYIRSIII